MGGPLLTPSSIETPESERKMIGTLMVLEASSINDAKSIVENDVYYTSDVVCHLAFFFDHSLTKLHP